VPMYSISVVGAVRNPGVYQLPPTSRISQAIKRANFIPEIETENQIQTPLSFTPSKRNIVLKRGDKEINLDMEKYYILGEEKNNPYIKDGDIVVVPALKKQVTIGGAINNPGSIELVEGDKISDIIALALGLKKDAYLEEAEIVRFKENSIDTEIIAFNLKGIIKDPHNQEDLLLQDDDRIYIRSIPDFHEKKYIRIFGEVKFPGIYAIEENKTTLLEIMDKCGGITENSDLANAFIQRKRREDIVDPEFERLKLMLVQDMSELEYEYFKTKSRELRGKFSVAFEKLCRDKDENLDVVLKNNDYIYFPSKTVTVSVSGQVKNPGLITYLPEKNYLYYIEQAGGFSWNPRKSKIRIIRAKSGEWLKPDKDTIVEVGDMIFVPEKPDFDYWEFFKDFMAVSAQIATVFIVIKNATQ
ncbi:MAG TPA: hypothetical protein ENL20_02225, partial [Candidatus Cloacimonetes bacterium]|nr:hypothetical protein [Candidatus Cloacimonadota bacterium]